MDTETVTRNVKGAFIAFGIVAAAPAALVVGQEISHRVKMLKPMKAPRVQAFVNVANQILAN